jgi:vacuole morphology and inheritance protein 14
MVLQLLKGACFPNAPAENREVFEALFDCWGHNPVATFSLCLLAQAYDLSAALIEKFAEVDVTVRKEPISLCELCPLTKYGRLAF